MRELYNDLNRYEDNGMLKAINIFGMETGLNVLSFLYVETHKNNTKKLRQETRIVTSWTREKYEQIYDLVKGLMKNEKSQC